MSRSLSRLIDSAEKALAAPAHSRLRFVWQEEDETADAVGAKIRDMIESGWASGGDEFVTICWRPPEEEAGDN
jgi:hypothetical protein